MFKVDKPTRTACREQGNLFSVCGAWMGGEFGGRVHACVGMYLDGFALPLKLPLLLIGYMPTQNRKLKKREKIKES